MGEALNLTTSLRTSALLYTNSTVSTAGIYMRLYTALIMRILNCLQILHLLINFLLFYCLINSYNG